MEAAGVTRALPIDATLIGGVLMRLRRDSAAEHACWTLGNRGSMEIDVHFLPVIVAAQAGPTWTSTARLYDPAHLAVATLAIEVIVRSPDAAELVLRPRGELEGWWSSHRGELGALARAGVDELAEELLWHASRGDVAPV